MIKSKKTNQKLSVVAKASFWFIVCGILQKSISLLTTPIFTRLLTTTEYGEFTVYNSWLNLFSIITTFRLDYAVFNKGMSKFKNERDQYTSAMQGATSIVTVFFFIVYLIFQQTVNEWTELSTLVTCLMFMELLFMPSIRFWTLRQRYEYRYKAVVAVTLLITVANAGFGVIAVLISHGDKGFARILSCILVETGIGAFLYFLNLSRGKQIFNWKYIKFAILFNIPLIPYYFSGYILQQADRIMIQKMVGLDAAAIYGVAYNVGLVMTIVSHSVNSAIAPWIYEVLGKKEPKKIPEKVYMILILVSLALTAFMALAPEAIRILAGNKYSEAVVIIPGVTASVLFMLMSDVFSNIEFFHDKNKFATVVSVIIAVLNIGMNYIGIMIFGFVAAGYTTLICYTLAALAHYFYVEKIIKREYGHSLFEWRIMIGITLIMLAVVVLMIVLYSFTIIRYAVIGVLLLVMLIKRKWIISSAKKIIRKKV